MTNEERDEVMKLLIRASRTNGTLLGQAATWIGGVVDAYKMFGGNKDSGELLYERLHSLNDDIEAFLNKVSPRA